MLLSIIIPVYNEETTIESVLERVASVKLPCKKEIIVVDDGSTDTTREKISNFIPIQSGSKSQRTTLRLRSGQAHNAQLITVFHQKNLGKGAAVQSGIKHATGDYILIQDADLEYNPEEIPKLLEPVIRNYGENTQPIAVYGSRFMHGRPAIPLLYYLGNKFLTVITNLLYRTHLTDMETGYKLLPAGFAKTMIWTSKRFDIEPEITARLIRACIPIVEVPITYRGRSRLSGKKLTARDAVGAIKTLCQLRFSKRHLADT